MKLIDFIKNFFGTKDTIQLTQKIEEQATALAVEAFAINAAINLISGCIAKCEFKTFINGKETKGEDYYTWNYQPNINSNSTQFINKLIFKLLFEGECLVIENSGQFVIADDFYQEEFALKENYFKSVVVKDYCFNKTFYMGDVLYFKLNDKNVTELLDNLMQGYNSLMDMAIGKYKRSGGRKGIVKLDMPAQGDEEGKKRLKKLFEKDFKEYFQAENAVLPLTKDAEYTEQNGEGSKKSTSEMKDIRDLLEEEFTRVAQAYKIPPAILKGDIANVSEITNNLLTFCIDPIVDLLQTEINRKLYGKAVLKGNKLVIDTTAIMHIDVFSVADKIDKLISDGIYSIDEIRTKISDYALNADYSKQHYITKNYTKIENLDKATETCKGGENYEE